MLSYEDAVKKVLEKVRTADVVSRTLIECVGHVAAESVYADCDLPQLPISGPDGYAVKSEDVKQASLLAPVNLQITATARAGAVPRRKLKPGTAIRIMTGAVLPDGADCVVRFEDTDEPADKNGPNKNNPTQVKIRFPESPGENIRPAGSNVRKGTLVLSEGTLIGPTQVSALAALGKTRMKVIRRPVVSIIATGDELISPGTPLTPGKTYNCNTAAIASLVMHYGGVPKTLGIARDNEAALVAKLKRGMKSDAIITSGGVSKGDYDLVRLVLGKLGNLIFSRIKMGPGAAVAFGLIESFGNGPDSAIPVFSLAGPPAGCLINCETLVRPALLKMRGLTAVDHPRVEATAVDSVTDKKGIAFVRYTHLQEVEGKYQVTINIDNRIGMLSSMAAANSLTIIPEGTSIKTGDKVRVLPLDWR